MATFSNRSGRWRAVIRKKNVKLFATFRDLETAKLWAQYKEDIIDEIENFDFKAEKSITLKEAYELKLKDMEEKQSSKRDIADMNLNMNNFIELLHLPIVKIDSETIRNIVLKMQNQEVRRGGSSKNDSGRKVIQSPATILRKLRVLSTVFGFLISKGLEIHNPVLQITSQINLSLKQAA